MSNIDKQALTAKTKELSSLMVERFSMNPVSCKLLNEAWEKEFPDEVAIAKRMLALLDELEAADIGVAELNDALCKLLPGCQYMDPPDGGSVTPLEQVTRMVADYRERMEAAEKRVAQLEMFINQSCYVFDGRDVDISDAYIDAATSDLMPKIINSDEDESCRYCSDGSYSGLPGGACEHCMGTGLDNPAAGIKLQIEGE